MKKAASMDTQEIIRERRKPSRRGLFDSSEGWPVRLSLSPRQCEIARLVAKDLTNKEIAAVLEISSWTVATHLRSIFDRLGVHSRAAMVARIAEKIAYVETIPPYPADGPWSRLP